MSASTLTGFSPIAEGSESTPGLFNSRFQVLQDNILSVNSVVLSPSVLSGSTWASIGLTANSNNSDYIRMLDSAGQRSTYRIGSAAGGTADGLNFFDESGNTMLVSMSKQSIRFYQKVIGPVFDLGGALTDTLNAATYGVATDSKESRIQAAINDAAGQGISRVYVPADLYPYSSSSVSFIYTVQMIREGGDPSQYDIKAYGATANGVADDTSAVSNAVAAAPAGSVVNMSPSGTVILSSEVVVTKKLRFTSNGATVKFATNFNYTGGDTLSAFYMREGATDVVFENIAFSASSTTAGTATNRFLWWEAGVNNFRGRVLACRFSNLTGNGSNFNGAIGFGSGADECDVTSCTFNDCPGAVFSQGFRARIINCLATSPKDTSFVINSTNATGSSVIGCKVYTSNTTCAGHIAIEQGTSSCVIANNYIYGVRSGVGIGLLSVANTSVGTGNVVQGNVVDGGSLAGINPSALLQVGSYYEDTLVANNYFANGPSGSASHTIVTISARNNRMVHNTIRCGPTASGTGAILVGPAGGELVVEDNLIDNGGLSYCIRVTASSNSSQPLRTKGNRFYNSQEGINVALPTLMPLYMENDTFDTVTSPVNAGGTDIQTYFNTYGAWKWPYRIDQRTSVYGNAAPTLSIWSTGDTVYNVAPTVTGNMGWTCTAGGAPGTWVEMGLVAVDTNKPSFASVEVGGPLTFTGTASSPAAGAIYKNAGDGLIMWGVTGVNYDLSFYNNAAAYVARVPAGTVNMEFLGKVKGVDGTALDPMYRFSSESSLGWYRSAASTMALSNGTLLVNGPMWSTSGISVGNATAGGGTLIPAISSISSKVGAFVVQGSASSFTIVTWAAVKPGDAIQTVCFPDAAVSSVSSGLVPWSHCTQAGQFEFRLSNCSTLAQNQSAKSWYFIRTTAF